MPAIVPTPTASNSQSLSNGVAIGGRLSVALEEVKRRLETELPGFITYVNEQLGLTGTRAIQQFRGFDVSPEDLTKGHINMLLVGGSVRFMPQGSRAFKAVGVVTLYLINERWSIPDQYLGALDRAGTVRLLLHNYLTSCYDPQGHKAWVQLVPMDEEPLPEKWKAYAGISLPYQVVQYSGDNPWAVSP